MAGRRARPRAQALRERPRADPRARRVDRRRRRGARRAWFATAFRAAGGQPPRCVLRRRILDYIGPLPRHRTARDARRTRRSSRPRDGSASPPSSPAAPGSRSGGAGRPPPWLVLAIGAFGLAHRPDDRARAPPVRRRAGIRDAVRLVLGPRLDRDPPPPLARGRSRRAARFASRRAAFVILAVVAARSPPRPPTSGRGARWPRRAREAAAALRAGRRDLDRGARGGGDAGAPGPDAGGPSRDAPPLQALALPERDRGGASPRALARRDPEQHRARGPRRAARAAGRRGERRRPGQRRLRAPAPPRRRCDSRAPAPSATNGRTAIALDARPGRRMTGPTRSTSSRSTARAGSSRAFLHRSGDTLPDHASAYRMESCRPAHRRRRRMRPRRPPARREDGARRLPARRSSTSTRKRSRPCRAGTFPSSRRTASATSPRRSPPASPSRPTARSCRDANVFIFVTGTPVDEYLNPKFSEIIKVLGEYRELPRPGQPRDHAVDALPRHDRVPPAALPRAGTRTCSSRYCPERVAQGFGLSRDRIAAADRLGVRRRELRAELRDLLAKLAPSLVRLTPEEAEVTKLIANSWRYLEFAIANQFYMMVERNGLDF